MKKRVLIIALVVVVATLFVAAPAFAGQQTRIMYANMNYDVYDYTPTATGTLHVTLSWTNPDGTGAPVWPIAEVDGVVQTYDSGSGELYYDVDVASLYAGTNPHVGTYSVKSGGVGKTIYVGVAPFIGDVPYRLVVKYGNAPQPVNNPVVIDTGAINVANPAQKWAYGVHGAVNVPNTGTWKSVCQYWPGTMNRGAGTSDVWANWDDYAFDRDTYMQNFANEWANTNYYPPVSSETAIVTSGPSTNARPGWVYVCPEIWTPAARPNVWTAIATDIYPKPGSLSATAAPLWHTYSFPDDAKAANVAYFWPSVNNVNASKRNFSGEPSTAAKITATFYGPTVTWVYRTGALGGRADVYIDGAKHNATPIELYTPTTQWNQTYAVTGLTDAAHTIEIRNAGTKNASSGAFFVYHDAFIAKTDAADPIVNGRMENNYDGSTIYDWPRVNNANASGGSFSGNPSTAASCAFSFQGDAVTLVYRTGALGGRARVYVDGVDRGMVEMYSATTAWKVERAYTGLGAGWHTVFIKNEGTKHASSLAFFVYIDAFKVGAATVEN
jgi:hypothetical protein